MTLRHRREDRLKSPPVRVEEKLFPQHASSQNAFTQIKGFEETRMLFSSFHSGVQPKSKIRGTPLLRVLRFLILDFYDIIKRQFFSFFNQI
jgi:hypothetical protein